MPCYDGRPPEPTSAERVRREGEVILCKQCRDLHAAGQLDSNPELKGWFIKHLAGDIAKGNPSNPQVDLDRKILAELLAGAEYPVTLVIHVNKFSGSHRAEDVYSIDQQPDGSLDVVERRYHIHT